MSADEKAPAIPRTAVESKLLRSVGYDPETQTLHAEFAKGGIYSYAGVSPDLYAEMMSAKSVGSHFLSNVVRGGFSHTRLDD